MTATTLKELGERMGMDMSTANDDDDYLMIPGYGAQPTPPPKYVPANDNAPTQELSEYEVSRIWEWLNSPPPVRRGEFMQTFTGKKFWPMDPRADEVCIEDIAQSLSLQCRYAGHCLGFYSVAEHCIHIARWLYRNYGAEVALCGLLHDAAEAYLVDVPRPVKPYLPGYKEAEAKVMVAIAEHFGLPSIMPACVKEADDRIIADELVNLAPMDWHKKHTNPLGVRFGYFHPLLAKEKFLEAFEMLREAAEVRTA